MWVSRAKLLRMGEQAYAAGREHAATEAAQAATAIAEERIAAVDQRWLAVCGRMVEGESFEEAIAAVQLATRRDAQVQVLGPEFVNAQRRAGAEGMQ